MHIRFLQIIFVLFLNTPANAQNDSIRIHYLGHSSFIIFFNDEISVLTDYGKPNAYLKYGWDSPIYDIGTFQPTIVTYSHTHEDHYDTTRISEKAVQVLISKDTLRIGSLAIIPSVTSEKDISQLDNQSYLFEYKGIRIIHLGDCQANIMNIDSAENLDYLIRIIPKNCDLLFIPIESTYKFILQAEEFIRTFQPKIVIPMHYWSEEYKCEFLNYLEKRNSMGSLYYKIIDDKTSDYTFTRTNQSNTIQIINLRPSKLDKQF